MASSASAMLKLTIGSCLVALLVCSSTSTANAAVTCGLVVNDLTPCISYVQYGGVLPAGCCNGVRALYSAAQSSSDRQGVCKCLKQAIGGISYTNYNLGLAAGLPSKCGVNLPYKISPSTDCNRVH